MGDSSWLRTQSVKAKTEEEEARLADAVPMAHIFPVVLNGVAVLRVGNLWLHTLILDAATSLGFVLEF